MPLPICSVHSTGYKNTLKAFQFGARGLIRDSLRFHCTRNYLICLQWIPQPPLHRSPTSCEGRILITAISNGRERGRPTFSRQHAIALASWRTRVSHTEMKCQGWKGRRGRWICREGGKIVAGNCNPPHSLFHSSLSTREMAMTTKFEPWRKSDARGTHDIQERNRE